MPKLVFVLLLSVSPFLTADSVRAQVTVDADPGSSVRTRADLERLLTLYEDVLQSPAYSAAVKRSTRQRMDQIRQRLVEGDFRLGDRVALYVQGEPTLPDTVAVEAGPQITLPLFGTISLQGVLRSEVSDRIAEALSTYINDPVVQAEGLMRVSVQGAVGQPGFYVLPASMLVSETLMAAGGPSQSATLDDLRIERGAQVLIEGDELQERIREGYSLDQLNLRAGDQIVLPQPSAGQGSGGIIRTLGIVSGIVGSLSFLIFRLTN